MLFRRPKTPAVRSRAARSFHCAIETLEQRRMLSTAQINYASFPDSTGLIGNSFHGEPVTNANQLELNDDEFNQARSVWYGQTVPAGTFTTHFSFTTSAESGTGYGLSFTLQNDDTTQVGGPDVGDGYSGINNSVAVLFEYYQNGASTSRIGFAVNGVVPSSEHDVTPVDFHNGDQIDVTIAYDGSTLSATVTDDADAARTFSTSEAVDIPQILGTENAIVGFTVGSGVYAGYVNVQHWDYTGTAALTITTPATAVVNTSSGKSVTLTSAAFEAGDPPVITYIWSVVKAPPGAKLPSFSANGTPGTGTINASVFKDGSYHLRVTATDNYGNSTTSDVSFSVAQKAVGIRMTPHGQHIHAGEHERFSAYVYDQFGHAMRTAPAITWEVVGGSGSVATDGLFASSSPSHVTVEAVDRLDDLEGTSSVIVEKPA